MLNGIDRQSETHKDTKKMLDSLRDICLGEDPDFMLKRTQYKEYLD